MTYFLEEEIGMRYRTFGRTGWSISEIGFGMWGMGGWTGSDDTESMRALHRSVELGVNFFDTAWAYGEGHSESLLGQLVRAYPNQTLYTASKIPPKNRKWPSKPHYALDETFPYDHIFQYTNDTLRNLRLDHVDLIQFHVWEDTWADDSHWQRAVQDLKQQGKVRAIGISVNRWEPENVLKALRSGLIDAVQVIYNIFDQNPEDKLFPMCRDLNVGVIARVPFDEGSLVGNLTKQTRWPDGDWRNSYFVPENLGPTVDRVEALRPLVPPGMNMAQMALRFILAEPTVSTIIPGMRKLHNVEENCGVSDGQALPADLIAKLREHRWDRVPTAWSQ
ncbi:MAG TPA: aldo/keto reductase [Aggregatilineales bacterium]|nr:aldo/keto reductase [Aggregatilineales bacterium]